jgi:hypothetical protein
MPEEYGFISKKFVEIQNYGQTTIIVMKRGNHVMKRVPKLLRMPLVVEEGAF